MPKDLYFRKVLGLLSELLYQCFIAICSATGECLINYPQPSILHQSLATNVGNKLLWSHIRPVYLLHIWFKQSTDQSCELNKWILWLLLLQHWPLNWSYRFDHSDWLFYLLGNNRFLFMNDFILFFDNLLVSCTATPSFDLYSSLWLVALDLLLLVDVGFSLD